MKIHFRACVQSVHRSPAHVISDGHATGQWSVAASETSCTFDAIFFGIL